MEKVELVGGACLASSNIGGDTSSNPRSGTRPSAALPPIIVRTCFWYSVSILLIFSTTCFGRISARSNGSLAQTAPESCPSNFICLGEAHESLYKGSSIQVPLLSLLYEEYNTSADVCSIAGCQGTAYFNERVRLLDHYTRQPASFNTSFSLDMRYKDSNMFTGDGMAFVISANNYTLGAGGPNLGFFDSNGTSAFKSIVVEFDTFLNGDAPYKDISDNHVSLDLGNVSWVQARNCWEVNVTLSDQDRTHVWVEYSNDTQLFEVRLSLGKSRPITPFLSYPMNLSDYVEEYVSLGFSSGAMVAYSNYYIWDWTFTSSFGSFEVLHARRDPTKSNLIEAVYAGIPALILACFGIVLYHFRSGRRRVYRDCQLRLGFIKEDEKMPIQGMPEKFSYKQLSVATSAFNRESKLGQGGFGSVYRGLLPSTNIPVAVKKINSDSAQGEKEFMAEISIISQLRHRNLIQLLGWCKDLAREKYLLVYELMPNGSLDKVLFGSFGKAATSLTWQQRFNIVTGTAAALDYLHEGWRQQVIHRDIKSSNIMLDGEWNAKLGDFGLARLVDHQREASTTGVAGTHGYIAPEAAASGHFTDKTDVFAFGAVVLEVACGRRAFLSYLPPEEMVLVDWVWRNLSRGDLLSTVDKRLRDYDTYWMEVVLVLGLLCSHPDPLARPCMRQVVQVLAGDASPPSIPITKPAPINSESQNGDGLRDDEPRRSSSFKSAPLCVVSPNISDYYSVSKKHICDSSPGYWAPPPTLVALPPNEGVDR